MLGTWIQTPSQTSARQQGIYYLDIINMNTRYLVGGTAGRNSLTQLVRVHV